MKVKGENSGRKANRLVRKTGLKRMGKMDVDEEVDGKKKLDQRKKELVKQLRKIEEFTDVPRKVVDEQ